jgi:aminopeptidase YwaD
MKKATLALFGMILVFSFIYSQVERGETRPTLLPANFLQAIIHEASGDLALQNEIFLTAVNRNRPPAEYTSGYFETRFLLEKLNEYGITQAEIVELPTRAKTTWDAEMAELWLTKPTVQKLTDLKEMPATLCSGSLSTDVTAGLVYVGPGDRESFYEGKDVKGKIVLVNGSPERARLLAVEKHGALGLIGYSSSHPEVDPDQIGWSSIRVSEGQKPTFAFMVSTRQGQRLRDMLERGQEIEVRAIVKSQMVPYREEMVAALLPGKDYPEEELVFTGHIFEGFAKQGANDDASGCVAILETARVLKKLMDEGKIPPLRRSVRFLFIPEISGTAAYIQKYPEIARRFFANINEDMVGEALIKNNAYFYVERSPYSLSSYLGDVIESLAEWLAETQRISLEGRSGEMGIVSPTGTKDPFYYRVAPYTGGSDHVVFIDGGVKVPAVMFIVWPDFWYHTSGDLPDKSDSTQLKRVVVLSAASAVFLANAGADEVPKILAEVSTRGQSRLAKEWQKAELSILNAAKENLHEQRKEAVNLVDQAFKREKEALASVQFFIRGEKALEEKLNSRMRALEGLRTISLNLLEDVYRQRCSELKVTPVKLTLQPEEMRLSRIIPVRTEKMRGYFNALEFRERMRELKDLPAYNLGRAEFEARNFIDGRRSILEIRNALAAEYGPIPLKQVENFILVLEKTGFVTLKK